jgi:hypothetical protein
VSALTDEHADEARREATRVALSLVRADWQGDELSWRRLWNDCPDQEGLARELVRMCRESLERLASVAGVSTGEMLHRQATRLVPPDATWAAVGSSAGDSVSAGRHRSPLADGEEAGSAAADEAAVDVRSIGLVGAADEPGPGGRPVR